MSGDALALAGIEKRFGSVHALRGADFTLRAGELHALLGENGAGKSTLMQIVYGIHRADAGTIAVDGSPVAFRSPREARRAGIGMVHQHPSAIAALTVAENVALAADWAVRPRELERCVSELSERLGLPLEPATLAGRLPIALKQRLEIVKALASDTRVLLLDEPTAVLAPAEAAELLRTVRAFVERGGAAVIITHKIDEALTYADRITVLRRGRVTLHGATAQFTAGDLARAMIGGDLPAAAPNIAHAIGNTRVLVDGLDVMAERGGRLAVQNASLEVRAGELVTMAAVEGNGQRELLRAIAGLLAPARGRVEVEAPVAFIPEDRTTEGLIPSLTLTENLALGAGRGAPWVSRGRMRWDAATRRMRELIVEHGIRASGPDVAAATLSGGNQQKLVLARALERGPAVIIAENPTRGLDVGATTTVHDRLRAAAATGAAVLCYSTDLDEVLALGDRVLVARAGTVRVAPAGAGKDVIGEMMLR